MWDLAKAQLANFTGKVFAHFSKPSRRFIEECIYGIQASGDTKLSSVVRAIDDDIRPILTGKRPGRNLDDEAPGTGVSETILAEGARSVRSDTLLLVAPTEGQAGVLRLFPRGKARFHHPPEGTQRPFAGGDARGARACATVRHAHSHHVTFDSHGRECNVPISFGAMPVRIPAHPDRLLHTVVAKGFGREPMMPVTSLPVDGSFKSQWRVVASPVLASAYFATVWIGRNVKREVLAEHLAQLGKRPGEVPEFAAYAIADGIRRAFTRFGRWVRSTADAMTEKPGAACLQLLPGFAELFDLDDG